MRSLVVVVVVTAYSTVYKVRDWNEMQFADYVSNLSKILENTNLLQTVGYYKGVHKAADYPTCRRTMTRQFGTASSSHKIKYTRYYTAIVLL